MNSSRWPEVIESIFVFARVKKERSTGSVLDLVDAICWLWNTTEFVQLAVLLHRGLSDAENDLLAQAAQPFCSCKMVPASVAIWQVRVDARKAACDSILATEV